MPGVGHRREGPLDVRGAQPQVRAPLADHGALVVGGQHDDRAGRHALDPLDRAVDARPLQLGHPVPPGVVVTDGADERDVHPLRGDPGGGVGRLTAAADD